MHVQVCENASEFKRVQVCVAWHVNTFTSTRTRLHVPKHVRKHA